MLQYILQIILFQLVFLLVFELLLKRETFFTYNRWYLLLTPLVSLVIPILNFQGLQEIVPAGNMELLPEVLIGNISDPEVITAESQPSHGSLPIPWILLYGFGFFCSSIIFLNKYRILRQLFNHRVTRRIGKVEIREIPQSRLACTFFNSIFLGNQLNEQEKDQILSHEIIHVHQKHSLDLIFFEALRIVFWFNPLVYVYQSKMTALHEYIADAGVVRTIEKKKYYQQLLNSAFGTENISFINQFFNHSLIKKRIVMLQKPTSKTSAKFKYLVLVPLLLGMLTYVSCTNELELDSREGKVVENGQTVKLQVQDANNLTREEEAKRNEIINYLGTEGNPNTLIVTDGKTSGKITVESNAGIPPPPPPLKSVDVKFDYQFDRSDFQANSTVPFMLIEEVPVFPGCEGLTDNSARKKCLTEKVTLHVAENFNTGLGKELGLKGINKIYVQFKISKTGAVEVLGVRGPAPELETEAERVVLSLPDMSPGKHNGTEVGVLYSLPITFRVGE